MATIIETLQAALASSNKPLREIARELEIDASTLSRVSTGARGSVSLATIQALADYFGLELKPARKRK